MRELPCNLRIFTCEKVRFQIPSHPIIFFFPLLRSVALAIMGGYAGLFVVVKIGGAMGGKKKEEPAPAPVASSAPSTGVPSIESPEFDEFLGSEAFEKLLSSDEQLGKVLADMK